MVILSSFQRNLYWGDAYSFSLKRHELDPYWVSTGVVAWYHNNCLYRLWPFRRGHIKKSKPRPWTRCRSSKWSWKSKPCSHTGSNHGSRWISVVEAYESLTTNLDGNRHPFQSHNRGTSPCQLAGVPEHCGSVTTAHSYKKVSACSCPAALAELVIFLNKC